MMYLASGKDRCVVLGLYIVENNATVRATAKRFGISKSTVHKDVTQTLKNINRSLYLDVKSVLMKNKEAVLNVLSSELVLDAVKACCDKVVYDKQRFNMGIFEDVNNRKDFIPLMMIVAMENIRPFFAEPHIILDSLSAQFLV